MLTNVKEELPIKGGHIIKKKKKKKKKKLIIVNYVQIISNNVFKLLK